jgi:hypothetical protein
MQDEGKLVAAEENVECGFVIKAVVEAAEHVKVDHGEGGGKRTDGMGGEVVRAEQAAFFSGEHHKKNRPFWLRGIRGKRVRQIYDGDRA